MNSLHTIPAGATLLALAGLAAAQASDVPTVPDVHAQFTALKHHAEWLGFRLGDGAPDPSNSTHWQGLLRHPDPRVPVFYATRNGACTAGSRANLAVIHLGSRDMLDSPRVRSNRMIPGVDVLDSGVPPVDRIVRNIEFTDYNHAGGGQIVGHILAIPLEGTCTTGLPEGKVVYYDVSDPYNPQLLPYSLTTASHKIGVIGLTQLDDGRYFMVMTWGTGGSVHFYMSEPDDLSTLAFYASWSPGGLIGGTWPIQYSQPGLGSHSQQTLNLIRQDDGQIYMIGTYNELATAPVVNGDDLAFLYHVQPQAPGAVLVSRVATRHMHCSSYETGSNCNFNAGVGAYVSPGGELMLYACTHDNDAPGGVTGMAEFRHVSGHYTSAAGPCTAFVELYQDDSGWSGDERSYVFDATDRRLENFADLEHFETDPNPPLHTGFTDHAGAAVWLLPQGCTCRLWEHAGFSGKYLDLAGTGFTQSLPDLGNTLWTSGSGTVGDKVSSVSFLGNCPQVGAYIPTATLPTVGAATSLLPGGRCAVLTIQAGAYAETGVFSKEFILRAAGGPVTIGQ